MIRRKEGTVIFQPTLPARGATTGKLELHFDKPISTHAPRTGSDSAAVKPNSYAAKFQPTLPARGATITTSQKKKYQKISTHAPRTGSDSAK